MRLRTLFLAPAAVIVLTGCVNRTAATAQPVPTAVSCGDASQLRQHAVDERRRRAGQTSDQEKITIGSRASFLASLAIIAELKCRVTGSNVDEVLKPAFAAAHKAEESDSFYERAVGWGDANAIATDAITVLTQQLPASPPK